MVNQMDRNLYPYLQWLFSHSTDHSLEGYLPRLEFVQWCLGPDGPFQRFGFVGPRPTPGIAHDLMVELRNRRGHMNHVFP